MSGSVNTTSKTNTKPKRKIKTKIEKQKLVNWDITLSSKDE